MNKQTCELHGVEMVKGKADVQHWLVSIATEWHVAHGLLYRNANSWVFPPEYCMDRTKRVEVDFCPDCRIWEHLYLQLKQLLRPDKLDRVMGTMRVVRPEKAVLHEMTLALHKAFRTRGDAAFLRTLDEWLEELLKPSVEVETVC